MILWVCPEGRNKENYVGSLQVSSGPPQAPPDQTAIVKVLSHNCGSKGTENERGREEGGREGGREGRREGGMKTAMNPYLCTHPSIAPTPLLHPPLYCSFQFNIHLLDLVISSPPLLCCQLNINLNLHRATPLTIPTRLATPTLFLIDLARSPNSSVVLVSGSLKELGEQQITSVVRALPPKLSCRTLVSLLSRYGMKVF